MPKRVVLIDTSANETLTQRSSAILHLMLAHMDLAHHELGSRYIICVDIIILIIMLAHAI